MSSADAWRAQRETLGAFIRSQRKLANLSLRELAALTKVSNPYLSQIERGFHEPSVRVLRSIADALDISAETLLAQAGLIKDQISVQNGGTAAQQATERAIRADPRLSDAQKEALIAVYRSYIAVNGER